MPFDFIPVVADPELKALGIHSDSYRYDFEKISKDLIAHREKDEWKEIYNIVASIAPDDLFFLLYFVLDIKEVNDPFVLARIYEFQEKHDMTLDLWPRGHFKSTIVTFGSPIQKLLKDSSKRICIFSMTRALALGHMRRIKTTIENNELLKNSFPDKFYKNPIQQSTKWSEEVGLIIKRKKIFTEASIEAWGLDNLPTGKHFTDIHYDDILDARNVNTQAQIDKTTYNLGLSMQLVHKKYEMCAAGTFYSMKDTYHAMIKTKLWKSRVYPAEVDEKGGWKLDGKPVMMSPEELLKRRSDLYVYFCQMLLHPVPQSDQKFNRLWIKFWTAKTKRPPMNMYILVDSAKKTEKRHDYTVMMVIGVDALRNYWILDIVRDKIDVYGRWKKLSELVKSWGVTEVGYEQYAAMVDTEVMNRQMLEDGIYFNIIELGGQVSKDDRIKKLVPDYQRGRWIIPDCLSYRSADGEMRDVIADYIDEYENWVPGRNVTHDDMLDCQARIYEAKMNVVFPTEVQKVELEDRSFDPLNVNQSRGGGSWMAAG